MAGKIMESSVPGKLLSRQSKFCAKFSEMVGLLRRYSRRSVELEVLQCLGTLFFYFVDDVKRQLSVGIFAAALDRTADGRYRISS